MDNLIRIYDNVIDTKVCKHYIKIIENAKHFQGMVADRHGLVERQDIKKALEVNLSQDYREETKYLLDIFNIVLLQYKNDINLALPITGLESVHGRIYRKNEGYYHTHTDATTRSTVGRSLTIILYLNNVLEGGELYFDYQDVQVEAREGRVVLFPPYWPWRHEAFSPLDTDRYIIRFFARCD